MALRLGKCELTLREYVSEQAHSHKVLDEGITVKRRWESLSAFVEIELNTLDLQKIRSVYVLYVLLQFNIIATGFHSKSKFLRITPNEEWLVMENTIAIAIIIPSLLC